MKKCIDNNHNNDICYFSLDNLIKFSGAQINQADLAQSRILLNSFADHQLQHKLLGKYQLSFTSHTIDDYDIDLKNTPVSRKVFKDTLSTNYKNSLKTEYFELTNVLLGLEFGSHNELHFYVLDKLQNIEREFSPQKKLRQYRSPSIQTRSMYTIDHQQTKIFRKLFYLFWIYLESILRSTFSEFSAKLAVSTISNYPSAH